MICMCGYFLILHPFSVFFDWFMDETTGGVMVCYSNPPYITLALFPMGNIIRKRACLSLLSTRNLWQTTFSPALRGDFPSAPPPRYMPVCTDKTQCSLHLMWHYTPVANRTSVYIPPNVNEKMWFHTKMVKLIDRNGSFFHQGFILQKCFHRNEVHPYSVFFFPE